MNYLVEGVIGEAASRPPPPLTGGARSAVAVCHDRGAHPWHDTACVALPSWPWPGALLLFGLFVWFGGYNPVEVWVLLFKGAFGDWFSWQNTLQRAAPLMLTALCVALPARAG
jgi:hypothetical protein